jgi:uncharacterized protein (DUF2344 family)
LQPDHVLFLLQTVAGRDMHLKHIHREALILRTD